MSHMWAKGGRMKFLVGSDFHFMDTTPRCRVDNFYATQEERVKWLVEQINFHKCPLFVPGDVLDKGSISQKMENMLIRELKKTKYPIYTSAGNHDMNYHSIAHLKTSSYWVLYQAGVIQHVESMEFEGMQVTAFQYGQKIENGTGMAMIHTLVFPHNPPAYLPTAVKAQTLLEKFDYDIILSGDNHMAFVTEYEGKILINGGGIFRLTGDKKHTTPKIYLYEEGEVTAIDVPYTLDNVEEEYLLVEKARNDRITAFVERVKVSQEIGLSFTDNIRTTLDTTEVSKEVQELIFRALNNTLKEKE